MAWSLTTAAMTLPTTATAIQACMTGFPHPFVAVPVRTAELATATASRATGWVFFVTALVTISAISVGLALFL